eukprot:TRINITY_DN10401_c0_g1_i1.p1 TRINITY_DN10401_c0_g1~~TRINITY_DN10401_c0_g1_i1.p1  ORF type:complete len:274 (+),score=47.06 TRINITY_DN10401_c0_g1_i1:57-878(+)
MSRSHYPNLVDVSLFGLSPWRDTVVVWILNRQSSCCVMEHFQHLGHTVVKRRENEQSTNVISSKKIDGLHRVSSQGHCLRVGFVRKLDPMIVDAEIVEESIYAKCASIVHDKYWEFARENQLIQETSIVLIEIVFKETMLATAFALCQYDALAHEIFFVMHNCISASYQHLDFQDERNVMNGDLNSYVEYISNHTANLTSRLSIVDQDESVVKTKNSVCVVVIQSSVVLRLRSLLQAFSLSMDDYIFTLCLHVISILCSQEKLHFVIENGTFI